MDDPDLPADQTTGSLAADTVPAVADLCVLSQCGSLVFKLVQKGDENHLSFFVIVLYNGENGFGRNIHEKNNGN